MNLRHADFTDYEGCQSIQVFGTACRYLDRPYFTAIAHGVPGGVDEAVVFEQTGLNAIVRDFYARGYITIFDRGHSVRRWSPRPFDQAELNCNERKTWNYQTSRWKIIEHAWAYVKLRSRRVGGVMDMDSFERIKKVIGSAVVLHNFLVISHDFDGGPEIDAGFEDSLARVRNARQALLAARDQAVPADDDLEDGQAARDVLIGQLVALTGPEAYPH